MNVEKKIREKNKVLRKKRTRKSIKGKNQMPRLTVFRSLKHFYLQIIDDRFGKTLCSATDKDVKAENPIALAREVGKNIAKKAKELKIEKVVFDRGSYKYHGRVKAAAEGAREEGLKF